jgi:ZIP family zinc transporter
MLLPVIAGATFGATLAGGFVALRLKDKRHLALGFSAGAVIGVAFFDLLPEALRLGERFESPETAIGWAGAGFLAYLTLDRVALLHGAPHPAGHDDDLHEHPVRPGAGAMRGLLAATSLATHSFLDGVAIGLAFQASAAVGAIVAIAVLAHDFSDGINTANVILKSGGTRRQALRWLIVDATAPVAGILSTGFFTLPDRVFANALAIFAGFFLYIGASDLIPESHHAHPKFLTTLMTLAGAATLYLAVLLGG